MRSFSVIAVSASALICESSIADIVHVPADFLSIQEAIDFASDDDEVIVAPGSYFETIDFLGKTLTLRSTGGAEVTAIDGTGIAFSVVTCTTGEGPGTIIDGFTITGGSTGTDVGGSFLGGGMYLRLSSPTITRCIFSGNALGVFGHGGGLAINQGNPAISDCEFLDNTAPIGGGLYINGSPELTDCTFARNTTTGPSFGGAAVFVSGSPTITRCSFSENASSNNGGAIYNQGGSNSSTTFVDCMFTGNSASIGGAIFTTNVQSPELRGCVFRDNQAGAGGAMYFAPSTSGLVERCRFLGNSASSDGGGIRTDTGITMRNCEFLSNTAGGGGGGLAITGSSNPMLLNCTIAANTGGGIWTAQHFDNPIIINCIVWGNTGGAIQGLGVPSVFFSNIEGSIVGVGNIDVDPLFTDLTGENLRLQPGSACIDAGDNSLVAECFPDLGDNERMVDDVATPDTGFGSPPMVDMGAYEFGEMPWADCNSNAVLDRCDIDAGLSIDCNLNGVPDDCDVEDGTSSDVNENGTPDECECLADITGSGVVGFADVVELLSAWGPCGGCPADIDGDGTVGFSDLLALLAAWGPCEG